MLASGLFPPRRPVIAVLPVWVCVHRMKEVCYIICYILCHEALVVSLQWHQAHPEDGHAQTSGA